MTLIKSLGLDCTTCYFSKKSLCQQLNRLAICKLMHQKSSEQFAKVQRKKGDQKRYLDLTAYLFFSILTCNFSMSEGRLPAVSVSA